MWYETLSRRAILGSLSVRARTALPLAPTRYETPQNCTLPASFALGRRGIENRRGFTLVEMLVSVALFSIVMLISVGALLALSVANRKAQAIQSVMNNLNITLDGMVRSIRMGSTYHCGSGVFTDTQDCPTGNTIFAFEAFGGRTDLATKDQRMYWIDTNGATCGKHRICRSKDNHNTYVAITAPEVSSEDMKFYVVGTTRGCDTVSPCAPIQPKVVITLRGTAGVAEVKTSTTFIIQATAVQRVLDI